MGSFAMRMAAHWKKHGEPLPQVERPRVMKIGFSFSVPVKILVEEHSEAAVAKAKIGEKVLLAIDDHGGGRRIAIVSEGRDFIGWLPSGDPMEAKLTDDARYRAYLRKIVRGRNGRQFEAVIVDIGIEDGTMDIPLG
ncbi:MAG: hypothetical protein EOO77_20000 [Oxalobacteraceae bacterium]|nr:MAG: hypothetical protein EOO77_20000 [Oxalobacteraceae bacterium]